MLLDCGLMFPDADMLGHRPRAARLHLAARARRPHRGLHRHPRPRGPHGGPVVPAARALVPDHRLGPDPRPGPQPHRGGRPPRPHRVPGGQRQRAAAVRPLRLRVHPGHPLGAPRLRHRVPHAAGHDPPHRRLQARPHAGRRPAHRPRRDGRHRAERGRAAAPVRLDERRPARALPLGDVGGQGAPRPVQRARRPAHRHRLLRQPHPPHPADRRRRDQLRPGGRHPRHVDAEERPAGPRDGPAPHPRLPPARHRGRRGPRPGQGLRDLHRLAGRADVGADADGRQREPLAEAHPRRHGDPELAPDPGQRDERVEGDRRPRAHRRGGRALRPRGRARHRPRQAGGAEDAPVDHPARVVHAGARRVPPPREPRPAGRADGRRATTTCSSARTATRSSSTTTACARADRSRPATSTSTAPASATWATASCATGGCWPRRASSS